MKKFLITLKYGKDLQGKSLDRTLKEFAEDAQEAYKIGFGCDDGVLGVPDDVEVEEIDADPYDLACAAGAKRKAEMLREIGKCPTRYVSYGDGDLGIAIKKADALKDIESIAPESIGEGTWYPCDKDGKELTQSQLAAATLGASRTHAKAKAVRENGKKGGRPKKQKPLA